MISDDDDSARLNAEPRSEPAESISDSSNTRPDSFDGGPLASLDAVLAEAARHGRVTGKWLDGGGSGIIRVNVGAGYQYHSVWASGEGFMFDACDSLLGCLSLSDTTNIYLPQVLPQVSGDHCWWIYKHSDVVILARHGRAGLAEARQIEQTIRESVTHAGVPEPATEPGTLRVVAMADLFRGELNLHDGADVIDLVSRLRAGEWTDAEIRKHLAAKIEPNRIQIDAKPIAAEDPRVAKYDAQTLQDAAVAAMALATKPGASFRKALAEAAARTKAGMGRDRFDRALARIGPAVVILAGAGRAVRHFLDGCQVPADILAAVPKADREKVSAARPPAETSESAE